ncbi:MAG: stage II sporulation protein R [Oscillospiraceae bacterium]|nr:stage II sporulation protein R [Oscillospiraceae bacterium]
MKNRILEAALLFMLALLLQTGGAALRTQEALSEKIIRVRVVAHSDAPADQSVKLQVRDRVLQEAAPLLADAQSRADAEKALRDALPQLADAARNTLDASGCPYPVALELRETECPTRYYDAFALPAGRYLSLRVLIGDAAGQNWWCVAFPPLCGAVAVEDASDAFSASEIRLMTQESPRYVLKFRVVECWETLRQRLGAS